MMKREQSELRCESFEFHFLPFHKYSYFKHICFVSGKYTQQWRAYRHKQEQTLYNKFSRLATTVLVKLKNDMYSNRFKVDGEEVLHSVLLDLFGWLRLETYEYIIFYPAHYHSSLQYIKAGQDGMLMYKWFIHNGSLEQRRMNQLLWKKKQMIISMRWTCAVGSWTIISRVSWRSYAIVDVDEKITFHTKKDFKRWSKDGSTVPLDFILFILGLSKLKVLRDSHDWDDFEIHIILIAPHVKESNLMKATVNQFILVQFFPVCLSVQVIA